MSARPHVPDDLKARVFLSCGQGTRDETEPADQIAEMLRREYDFDVYVAGDKISSQGVKEAVFERLESSEYFLFIDFPREELDDGREKLDSGPYKRGSLFTNQELALAVYLGLPFLGFRHKDVRERDGLLKFIQADFPEFDTSMELLRKVREYVGKHEWVSGWRNELRMTRREGEWDDAGQIVGHDPKSGRLMQRMARYFHTDVQNLHNRKTALGCVANVDRILNADTGKEIEFRPSEVKWAGIGAPAVSIRPGKRRQMDTFFVYHDEPTTIWFVTHSDSGYFLPPVGDVRNLEVEYEVSSENMGPARITVAISVGQTINDVRVVEVPTQAGPR